jgi:hypothetical protein
VLLLSVLALALAFVYSSVAFLVEDGAMLEMRLCLGVDWRVYDVFFGQCSMLNGRWSMVDGRCWLQQQQQQQ